MDSGDEVDTGVLEVTDDEDSELRPGMVIHCQVCYVVCMYVHVCVCVHVCVQVYYILYMYVCYIVVWLCVDTCICVCIV